MCDTDAASFGALTIQGEPPKFTDKLADVLADAGLPAVAVATPAATHYEVVKQCLEAAKTSSLRNRWP